MSDGLEIPGGWEVSGFGEPPAAVLRRAITRVESMLDRLEFRSVRDSGLRAVDVPVDRLVVVPIRPSAAPAPNAARVPGIPNARDERSDAVAQGKSIMLHAQHVADRMQAQAREAATQVLAAAHRESAALVAMERAAEAGLD